MRNKANFRKSQMNVTNLLTTNYEQLTMNYVQKNKPNSKPIKANSKPIKANIMPKQSQFKPKQTQFQRQKMLLRMTINNRRKSLGYFADEIEAPNAYDRLTKKYHGQYPGFICELFSRLDFDNMLDFSQIWESFGDRILRRTAKCGPTAMATGWITINRYTKTFFWRI